MDQEDYQRISDLQEKNLFETPRISGNDPILSNLTNEDLTNPVEEVYKKRRESQINGKKKAQKESKPQEEKPAVPRVVDVRYYSADDFYPDPIYVSSCDEMDVDVDYENDDIGEEIDFGSIPSSEDEESENTDPSFLPESEEGRLLIDHTKHPKPPSISKALRKYQDPTTLKRVKMEIDHNFCFLCDRKSHKKVGHDKVDKIIEMIQENLIEQDDGRIARHVHEYYKTEIYDELIERGEKDVKMWTSESIRKHISEILDPRYQLLKIDVRAINKQIKKMSKYCYKVLTFDNGKEKEDYDPKAQSEVRAWLNLKKDLLKMDYDKLPLCNKKSKLDLQAAGTVGPKLNFTQQKQK